MQVVVARSGVRYTRGWQQACLCAALYLSVCHAGVARAADAAGDLRQWLGRVAVSAGKLNYEGMFVYRRDDQLVAMRVTHVSDELGGRERVVSLNGKFREVFRNNDGVACILPERKVLLEKGGAARRFPVNAFSRLGELEKQYKFSFAGTDRTAGRPSRIIVIEPRDNFRYGYRIWVDEAVGLLLQSDLVNEEGKAVEQIMFTSLQLIDKPTPALLDAVTLKDFPVEQAKALRQSQAADGVAKWAITQAPNGFMITERYRRRTAPDRPPMDHIVLTDGLATVSVFIEQMSNNDSPFVGVSRMGAVNAYGAVVSNYQLTVVGEVPAATVQLIGQSISLE